MKKSFDWIFYIKHKKLNIKTKREEFKHHKINCECINIKQTNICKYFIGKYDKYNVYNMYNTFDVSNKYTTLAEKNVFRTVLFNKVVDFID